MSTIGLQASVRSDGGKGYSRRLRRTGQIPAVAYGKGREPLALAVSPKALVEILQGPRGRNTVIELSVGDEKVPTLLCEWQVHPVTRELLHADFYRIDLEEPVDVRVKLEVTGRSTGVTMGGKFQQVYRTIPLRCKPLDVPVNVVHDITDVGLDEVVAVKDLQLPEGVQVTLPPNQTLLGVYADKRRKEDGKEEEGTEKKK